MTTYAPQMKRVYKREPFRFDPVSKGFVLLAVWGEEDIFEVRTLLRFRSLQ